MDPELGTDHEFPDELGGEAALTIGTSVEGSCGSIVIAGELDLQGTDLLIDSARLLLAGHLLDSIILDMRNVRFVDSAGLQAVLRVRQLTHDVPLEFHLWPSPTVSRVIDLAGLGDVLVPDDDAT